MALAPRGPLASLLLLAVAGLAFTQQEAEQSVDLMDKIRQQLMADNYDYLPSDSESGMPMRRLAEHEYFDEYAEYGSAADRENKNDIPEEEQVEDDLPPRRSAYMVQTDDRVTDADAQFIPIEAQTSEQVEDRGPAEQPISQKDLLYYMDDEILNKKAQDIADTEDGDKVESKTKYKVLKSVAGSRRRSGNSMPQLIQEENSEGVSILNMGDGLFPEFQLPSNRRQYMQELHPASDTEMVDPSRDETTKAEGSTTLNQEDN